MYSEIIREREELSEQIRALKELKKLGSIYGFEIFQTCHECEGSKFSGLTWLTLAAVKEQNGAAMSLGRTSTFIDIYAQRD